MPLPEECGRPEGMCGKLSLWLYGFRPAAAALESLYASLLEGVGFKRGLGCGVVFCHAGRDVSLAVHGDDFTLCALEEDLVWIKELMPTWFDVKIRCILGRDEGDQKEMIILGRTLRCTEARLEHEADPRHSRLIL